jgi:hypothetical protein
MIVNWGKHAGTDLQELAEKEPAYASWYALKCHNGEHHADFVFISSMIDVNAIWINFGKYKNRKLIDVIESDRHYSEWMRNSPWINEKRPIVAEALKQLLGN